MTPQEADSERASQHVSMQPCTSELVGDLRIRYRLTVLEHFRVLSHQLVEAQHPCCHDEGELPEKSVVVDVLKVVGKGGLMRRCVIATSRSQGPV